jgi:hypothetical protein
MFKALSSIPGIKKEKTKENYFKAEKNYYSLSKVDLLFHQSPTGSVLDKTENPRPKDILFLSC